MTQECMYRCFIIALNVAPPKQILELDQFYNSNWFLIRTQLMLAVVWKQWEAAGVGWIALAKICLTTVLYETASKNVQVDFVYFTGNGTIQ